MTNLNNITTEKLEEWKITKVPEFIIRNQKQRRQTILVWAIRTNKIKAVNGLN